MTEYYKYLKNWTTERGITSFLGSDKPEFQQDWQRRKVALVEARKPIEEDIGEKKIANVFKALVKQNEVRADSKYNKALTEIKQLRNIEALQNWVKRFAKNLDDKKLYDYNEIYEELRTFEGPNLLPNNLYFPKTGFLSGVESARKLSIDFLKIVQKYRNNPSSIDLDALNDIESIEIAEAIIKANYVDRVNGRLKELKNEYSIPLKKNKSGYLTEPSQNKLDKAIPSLIKQAKNEILPEIMKNETDRWYR